MQIPFQNTALLTLLSKSAAYSFSPSDVHQRHLQDSEICSCNPTGFTITLNFTQTCEDNDLEDKVGLGISSTDCTITMGNGVLNPLIDDDALTDDDAVAGSDGPGNMPSLDEILEGIPWMGVRISNGKKDESDEKKKNKKKRQEQLQTKKTDRGGRGDNKEGTRNGHSNEPIRFLQQDETIPAVITDIQWIELDQNGNVVTIDTLLDITASDGDSFSFESISSQLATDLVIEDQLDFVPETGVLFLVGRNSEGTEVRGRFVWNYSLDCGNSAVTIEEGDDFGWVTFSNLVPALSTFCPANADVPTPSPVTITPMANPSPSPTASPSQPPTTSNPTPAPTIPQISPPTANPTVSPTTIAPQSESPTNSPSISPVRSSVEPTASPQVQSNVPTVSPTFEPTPLTQFPTESPTSSPISEPTTRSPSKRPTYTPTDQPTLATFDPTNSPATTGPTNAPTKSPTNVPTKSPTNTPTRAPTAEPTPLPTIKPNPNPSPKPTPRLTPATTVPTYSPTLSTDTPTFFDEFSMSVSMSMSLHIEFPYMEYMFPCIDLDGKSSKRAKSGKGNKCGKSGKSSAPKTGKTGKSGKSKKPNSIDIIYDYPSYDDDGQRGYPNGDHFDQYNDDYGDEYFSDKSRSNTRDEKAQDKMPHLRRGNQV
mmetsp:Transcript_28411/g.56715  ORF Transcript_28411/g.56715 Transcript_28411/m.56715 type:complete len:651 (-) Transcript_28411:225-2177(-)